MQRENALNKILQYKLFKSFDIISSFDATRSFHNIWFVFF